MFGNVYVNWFYRESPLELETHLLKVSERLEFRIVSISRFFTMNYFENQGLRLSRQERWASIIDEVTETIGVWK